MKRTFLIAMLSIVTFVIPQFAIAGEHGYSGGYPQHHDTWDRDGDHRDFRSNDFREDYRRGDYGYGYARPDYRDHHVGRSVAIVGGSAAGGALIGAAVGQGRGAAIGAVVGGVAGLVGDQIARHHGHDRR